MEENRFGLAAQKEIEEKADIFCPDVDNISN